MLLPCIVQWPPVALSCPNVLCASGWQQQRCSGVEEHQPPPLCCPSLLIHTSQCLYLSALTSSFLKHGSILAVHFPLFEQQAPKELVPHFCWKLMCLWKIGPRRISAFWHCKDYNVFNILLSKIIQFICWLLSLLAVFKGFTTTAFYLNHIFLRSSKWRLLEYRGTILSSCYWITVSVWNLQISLLPNSFPRDWWRIIF